MHLLYVTATVANKSSSMHIKGVLTKCAWSETAMEPTHKMDYQTV